MRQVAALDVKVSDSRESNIYMDALRWLLEYSGEDVRLVQTDHPVSTQKRKVAMVLNKEIDIMYAGTSAELEATLTPLRYPISRGLIGHRLLIVNQQHHASYDQITQVAQLALHPALLGFGWTEVDMFRNNGLLVYERSYDDIFTVIDQGHPGYFSRGILEVYGELEDRPELTNLMVHPQLMMSYPSAMYFFVHHDNQQLAQLISQAFINSHEDGSYQRFFYDHPLVRHALEAANVSQRTNIGVDNAWFPQQSRQVDDRFWH
ncbi:hypothetical protein CHH28_10070 [Bacterioplanes sanyensis]|uniref:Solute-binding protein family 3/N-terminal domain-containing protein n=1 Tax=Bacterioplanes sanyensis TaxID=1249553 RepID=A0A222FK29_9GAMM|nr:hypothetical protein [Bacterioplanes sanyensis]ASP39002.1 hypothetical protein CHH28_10070 [Bacterioplanes sanyensis]